MNYITKIKFIGTLPDGQTSIDAESLGNFAADETKTVAMDPRSQYEAKRLTDNGHFEIVSMLGEDDEATAALNETVAQNSKAAKKARAAKAKADADAADAQAKADADAAKAAAAKK